MLTSEIISFYFSASIGINALCAAVLLSSGLKEQRGLFKALFFTCLISIASQYATWQYHSAIDLASALYWLRMQTSLVILGLPTFCMAFVIWSRQKIPNWATWLLWLVGIGFCIFNMLAEHTLRFSGDVELIRYTLFNGEQASRLIGSRSLGIQFYLIYGIAVLLVLVGLSAKLLRVKRYTLGALLISILLLQLITALMSAKIDNGELNMIYLGGLPFTVLNFVACISISASLNRKSKSLRQEIDARGNLEMVLSGIAKGALSKHGTEFFAQMMKELQKLSGCKVAYISLFNEHDAYITTTVVMHENRMLDNYTYRLSDVPQELVSTDKCLLLHDDFAAKYPQIEYFKMAKAKSYLNAPMTDKNGKPMGNIVMLFDQKVSDELTLLQTMDIFRSRAAAEIQRNMLESQLHKMAYFDYQTQLPNITKLHEKIAAAFDASTQSDNQSILIVFDLNHFNEINQDYGFEAAEACIRELGNRLSSYANKDIFIARSGGDEFSVLIEEVAMLADGIARLHWDAIRAKVEQEFCVEGRVIKLSASAGAVIFPEQINKAHEVKRCAEIALAKAKHSRGDTLEVFDVTLLEENNRKRAIESLLHQAIEQDKELFPVYQPKVDAQGRLIGAEVLCRWISAEVGFVPPDEFIAMAENSGSINKLGFWMVRKVCEHLHDWQKRGLTIPSRVAINVSAVQLVQKDFVEDFIAILDHYEISPAQVEIELTESGLLTNIDGCIEKLNALRETGLTIALDDFGTGYSSLSYLKDLPLDVLKIDRSFVNVIEEKKASELARSIITIAHHMSLDVVAEGVEEPSQVNTLAHMGCAIFQGYHFAKPMKADEFYQWAIDNAKPC
ncbi:putative bifunctional diguanylate cyclase/phosphodiesterase [Glaciecola siphonariae]|uniref:Bifunctional diguanylate cyclase/phosphodiesterase n=1 Tax=Glaciecola siphonariae TaxID=521012 RepID=A0ABV9LVF0_9ALTE